MNGARWAQWGKEDPPGAGICLVGGSQLGAALPLVRSADISNIHDCRYSAGRGKPVTPLPGPPVAPGIFLAWLGARGTGKAPVPFHEDALLG